MKTNIAKEYAAVYNSQSQVNSLHVVLLNKPDLASLDKLGRAVHGLFSFCSHSVLLS